jgi:uncharacterized OB-fold protein
MLEAARCPNGHYHYPPHPRCPDCGDVPDGRIDLAERTATVVTWTSAFATPPGVREPNSVAIVEFDLDTSDDGTESGSASDGRSNDDSPGADDDCDGENGAPNEGGTVRAIGGLTTDEVAIGDRVKPVYVEQVRAPGAGIREPESQEWDGYRFEPL